MYIGGLLNSITAKFHEARIKIVHMAEILKSEVSELFREWLTTPENQWFSDISQLFSQKYLSDHNKIYYKSIEDSFVNILVQN